jgi:Family of unknown function (DUF6152)
MNFESFLTIARAWFILAAMPLAAHHSFMAEFDQSEAVTLYGVVTKIEWINPHTFFYLDVKDEGGKTVNWTLQTGSPSALISRGWTRSAMKVGDHVIAHGYRAKEHRNLAAARSVTLADGRTLFGGQTDDGGPAK